MNDELEPSKSILAKDSWARARDGFLELVELDEVARARELDRIGAADPALRTWIERLLAQDRPEPVAPPPSERFGAYAPIRRIATGGMGDVFLGRRTDGEFEREVAIKVLKPGIGGEELVKRFLRERQTLARLDHEYISRLLDGGTTENGHPYLILEYVEGESLDAYCRARSLSIEVRLRLFLRVLAAVAHAHDRGVIHRDLKPGNILVRADGAPRLLDFGISRSNDEPGTPGANDAPLTRTGHRLFTPEYASPEQIRGDAAGETSDVFALGVILHQLLTGERPWPDRLSRLQLEVAILESTPPPPSRRTHGSERRALEGDLDTIVGKCLRKEPSARYRRVADLMADIERHLRGEPIHARPIGFLVRWARFARRRPWPILAATGLVASLGVYARMQFVGEEHRSELARTLEARIEGARNLREQGRFAESATELGAVLTALDTLPDEKYLRALATTQLAVVANHDRRFDESLRQLDIAEPWIVASDSGDPRATRLRVSALNARAFALAARGRKDEARVAAAASLEICRAKLPPGDPLTIDALLEIAEQSRSVPATTESLVNIDDVVDEARKRRDPHDAMLGSALNTSGLLHADAFRYEDAIERYREALDVLGWHHGEGHEVIALLHSNIGDSMYRLGRFEEAIEEHSKALASRRTIGKPGYVVASLECLTRVAIDQHDLSRAERLLSEARHILDHSTPADRDQSRRIRLWRAIVDVERAGGAAELAELEAVLATPAGEKPLSPELAAQARMRLGRAVLELGDQPRARAHLEAALKTFEKLLGPAHRDTVAARRLLDGI